VPRVDEATCTTRNQAWTRIESSMEEFADDHLSAEPMLYDDPPPVEPESSLDDGYIAEYYDLQKRILFDIDDTCLDSSIKCNRIDGRPVDPESLGELFQLQIQNQLSDARMNVFLNVIHRIVEKDLKKRLAIPKDAETLRRACFNQSKMTAPLKVMYYDTAFPTAWFGDKDHRGWPLKAIRAVHLDITRVISGALLDVNPQHFAAKPERERDCTGFKSSKCFQEIYTDMQILYGEDVVPLCIGITMDKATINKTMNRSQCPALIYFLNVESGPSFDLHFVGYVPIHFPYSPAQLDWMLERKIEHKEWRNTAIKYLRDFIKKSYLEQLLSPVINEMQTKGCIFQVGKGPNHKIFKNVRPLICMISGDTEELSNLAGCHLNTKRPCRCCLIKNAREFYVDGFDVNTDSLDVLDTFLPARNVSASNKATIGVGDYIIRKLNSYTAAPRNVFRKNDHDQAALSYAIDNGLSKTHGQNFLYGVVKGQFPEYKIYNSLHTVVVPDLLHTIGSGIGENVIAANMSINYAIGAIDPEHFGQNVGILDNRIATNFCCSQTLQLYHFVRFPNGASPSLSKANALKAKSKNTLEGSGMESWKKVVLLQQILCCIGTKGIVPTQGEAWCREFGVGREWPILSIMVNSMTLLLDFYWIVSKSRSFNERKIKQLVHIYMNLGAHLSLLYTLQKDLLHVIESRREKGKKGKGKKDEESPAAQALHEDNRIKFHLGFHIIKNLGYYGPIPDCFDTQKSEERHKTEAKLAFEMTNKKRDYSGETMLMNVIKMGRSTSLRSLFKEMNLDKDGIKKVRAKSNPYDAIQYSPEKQVFSLVDKKKGVTALHPLIWPKGHNQTQLAKILISYATRNTYRTPELEALLTSLLKTSATIKCLKRYKTSTGICIHANMHYNKDQEENREKYKYNSNFSFIEIQVSKEGLDTRHGLAQVLGILELKEDTIVLIVLWLDDCNDSTNVMQYRRMKYYAEGDRGFRVECVAVDSVVRGAYVYRCPDQKSTVPTAIDKKSRFFCIPYDRVFRDKALDYDEFNAISEKVTEMNVRVGDRTCKIRGYGFMMPCTVLKEISELWQSIDEDSREEDDISAA
jgi:hypothetical protein